MLIIELTLLVLVVAALISGVLALRKNPKQMALGYSLIAFGIVGAITFTYILVNLEA